MEKKYTIRLADLNDLEALQNIGDRLFDYPVKPERAMEFLNDPRHHLALATCAGDLVGMVSALHYVHPDKDPMLFINEVSVVEGHRNKGIGRELVKFMVAYGQRLGCREAWVATEFSNHSARKAYKAAGGREESESIVMFEFMENGNATY